ncbi:MAG: RsmD family RNA methyltransferase [Bacteroidota bacterium]|nr:RsmD family RNA methyltransferase [Bacteroidota bacterium]
MRIVNGKYKAKKIPVPKNFKGRPTTSFAKEGLFQLLRNRYHFENLDVLDLFAGSGNISYEFISMAVKSVTAVERNSSYTRFINKQVEKFFPGQLNMITADAYTFLKKGGLQYDVIFADPPYDDEKLKDIPDLALNNESLKENAMVIVEHSDSNDFSDHLNLVESRRFGKVNFSFFQKK